MKRHNNATFSRKAVMRHITNKAKNGDIAAQRILDYQNDRVFLRGGNTKSSVNNLLNLNDDDFTRAINYDILSKGSTKDLIDPTDKKRIQKVRNNLNNIISDKNKILKTKRNLVNKNTPSQNKFIENIIDNTVKPFVIDNPKSKKLRGLMYGLTALGIGGVGYGGYKFYKNRQQKKTSPLFSRLNKLNPFSKKSKKR
jgi:hypothetical protein